MDPVLVLALALAAWALVYAVACRWWPWAACGRCHGDGKSRQPGNRSAWRRCPRCKGSGRRLRIGRRILNHLSDDAREATKKETAS